MRKIRGFDWIFYGDGTDSAQHLIESIDVDRDKKSLLLKLSSEGHIAPLIVALQENETLLAQTSEGLYELQYACGFKSLDAASVPQLPQLNLKLTDMRFYPGVFTH